MSKQGESYTVVELADWLSLKDTLLTNNFMGALDDLCAINLTNDLYATKTSSTL